MDVEARTTVKLVAVFACGFLCGALCLAGLVFSLVLGGWH